MRLAVIGVGLIGGSVALAARQRLGAEVCGYDHSLEVTRRALERGVLDRQAESLEEALADAQAAFVAVPVAALPETVAEVVGAVSPDCVVSDVGSTKRAVVSAVKDPRFVGGHPMAGLETSGVEHARSDLFEGATWYLTPTERTSGVLYERLHRLLRGLGARPEAIDAETHDAILAAVSHLPHVLANLLVSEAARTLSADQQRLPATGPSFRDATRVAGAPSSVWSDIYISNADALGDTLGRVIDALAEVRGALERGDRAWVTEWNDRSAEQRRRLIGSQLGSVELVELRASVPNRPGVVAQLALELGRAGVNIADMALYPAPDMSEGVIALWLAGETEAGRAQALVQSLGFPVSRPG